MSQVTGWTAENWGSIPCRGRDFSLLHIVHTGSGAHPASYAVGTKALSPGVKRQGLEADHLCISSAEVKNDGAIPTLPHSLNIVLLNALRTGTNLPF
jgi:hypothetical protein